MKRFWVLVLALATVQVEATAQLQRNVPENSSVFVGVKGGVNLPRMLYWHNESLSHVKQQMAVKPVGGLFVEFPLGRSMDIAPEVMFMQRGTVMSYRHHSGSNVNYSLSASYIDLRLPWEIRWPIQPYIQPYLALGAEVGMRMGGEISMDRTAPASFNQTIDVSDANMRLIHAGVFAGVGFRSVFEVGRRDMMLKISACYHQGLVDTYSKKEHLGQVQAQNVNAYQIVGKRLPRNLEVTLGVAVSLTRKDDACATFSGERYSRHGGRHLFGF